jgi:hypothetical protein
MVNSSAQAGTKAKVDAPKDLTKAIVSTREVLKRYTKEEVAKVSLVLEPYSTLPISSLVMRADLLWW